MSGMCKAVYLKEGTYDCFTLPRYPWQKVGTDFFEWQGTMYLLVEDYFSRYIEIVKLSLTMSGTVVAYLKTIFARFSIPKLLISDNGPQFASGEMKQFAATYHFNYVTSSPAYPQGNGESERVVPMVKRLLESKDDINELQYRATSMGWCGYSY